jgi:protein-S-isoprenylcysteine O-methyltransferase Ste14
MKIIAWAVAIALLCWHPVGMLILLVLWAGFFYKPTPEEKDHTQQQWNKILDELKSK